MMAAWMASRGIGPYIRQHFFDKTFQGLYHVNAFDLAPMVSPEAGIDEDERVPCVKQRVLVCQVAS